MVSAGQTRAEIVAGQIRQAIRAGAYVSGERLLELTLAERLKVSQNTIRDALRLLEAEGWVVKHARHGVYVRSFTHDQAAELFTLWEAIGRLALRWTLESANRKDLAQLRRLIQSARKETLAGAIEEAVEAIFGFHLLLADLCGRVQTGDILRTILNRIYILEMVRQMRAPRSLHAHEAQLLLYEKLVTLMEDGSAGDAEALLDYLIRTEAETLLPLLR
jgi:DNA-binding GntR family transcriptional regulator